MCSPFDLVVRVSQLCYGDSCRVDFRSHKIFQVFLCVKALQGILQGFRVQGLPKTPTFPHSLRRTSSLKAGGIPKIGVRFLRLPLT